MIRQETSRKTFILVWHDYHLPQEKDNFYWVSHLHSLDKQIKVQTELMLEPGNQREYKKIFWNNIKEPTMFMLHSLSPLSLVISSLFWSLFLTLVSLLT